MNASSLGASGRIDERRCLSDQRVEAPPQIGETLAAESGADLTGINETTAFIVNADQKSAESGA